MLVCSKRLEKIKRIEVNGVRRIKVLWFLKQPQSSAVAREWQLAERWPPAPIVSAVAVTFCPKRPSGSTFGHRFVRVAAEGVSRGPPRLPAGGELGPPGGGARPG